LIYKHATELVPEAADGRNVIFSLNNKSTLDVLEVFIYDCVAINSKGGLHMEFQIGGRLKERRKSKGLSITDLAEQSGVSTGLISQI